MGKELEAALVRALAHLAATAEFAHERHQGLSDIDTQVAIDQLDCAGRHGINVLSLVRRDLVGAPPIEVASALARLAAERGIDAPNEFGSCLHETFHAFLDAADAASKRSRTVPLAIEELEWAACHLENVLYLLDPQIFRRAMHHAGPDERIRLAALEEVVELEIAENRKRVERLYTSGTREV